VVGILENASVVKLGANSSDKTTNDIKSNDISNIVWKNSMSFLF
jgi:hypothetical protein